MTDCSDFIGYLGSSLSFNHLSHNSFPDMPDSDWVITIRAMNKIICMLFLMAISIYCLIFRFLFKKRLRSSLKNLLKSTIFTFLDDLPHESEFPKEKQTENSMEIAKEKQRNAFLKTHHIMNFSSSINTPMAANSYPLEENMTEKSKISIKTPGNEFSSFPSSENEQNELNKEYKMLKKQAESYSLISEYKEVYICDCADCCCSCCCLYWKLNVFERFIRPFTSDFMNTAKQIFRARLKFFCFYFIMLGPFIYNPVREIFSLAFNDCAKQQIDPFIVIFLKVIFFVVDLFCGSLEILLYIFIINFLNTKMELTRMYFVDKVYRANIIYYTLCKGFWIAILYFCLKLAFKIAGLFQYSCYELMEGPYSMLWQIFRSLLLLSSIKFNNSMKNETIQQDCRFLRAHAQYFSIQNNLLKNLPKAKDVYKILKKPLLKNKNQIISINNGEEDLIKTSLEIKKLELIFEAKCKKLGRKMQEELRIIESQKFKNILRNNGYLRYIPMVFIVIFTVFLVLTIADCVVLLVKNNYNFEVLATNYAHVGSSLSMFVECSILPVLMFYCIRKSTVRK